MWYVWVNDLCGGISDKFEKLEDALVWVANHKDTLVSIQFRD